VHVAPLTLDAFGPDFAADEVAGALELAQDGARVDTVARVQLVAREQAVGTCVARDEL
jgi:hypothetical protein